MGRNTFLSIVKMIGKPLPNRRNLVLSETKEGLTGAEIFDNWEKIFELAKNEEVFVIGGANVYKQAIQFADKLYITEVDCTPEGDVSFPEFNKNDWNLVSEEPHLKDDKNEYNYNFKIYDRKK
jgi:dihydrofolate reductase